LLTLFYSYDNEYVFKKPIFKSINRKKRLSFRVKEGKIKLLDEYCQTTGKNRKYVIRKIRTGAYLKSNFGKRKRKKYYDGYVKAVLVEIWEIFDHPCGQRLESLLKDGWADKLSQLGEINCSKEVLDKLRKISSKTIDRKLKHQKNRKNKTKV
jgi:hypothetical protein